MRNFESLESRVMFAAIKVGALEPVTPADVPTLAGLTPTDVIVQLKGKGVSAQVTPTSLSPFEFNAPSLFKANGKSFKGVLRIDVIANGETIPLRNKLKLTSIPSRIVGRQAAGAGTIDYINYVQTRLTAAKAKLAGLTDTSQAAALTELFDRTSANVQELQTAMTPIASGDVDSLYIGTLSNGKDLILNKKQIRQIDATAQFLKSTAEKESDPIKQFQDVMDYLYGSLEVLNLYLPPATSAQLGAGLLVTEVTITQMMIVVPLATSWLGDQVNGTESFDAALDKATAQQIDFVFDRAFGKAVDLVVDSLPKPLQKSGKLVSILVDRLTETKNAVKEALVEAINAPDSSGNGGGPPTVPPSDPPVSPPTVPPTVPPSDPPVSPPTAPPTVPPSDPPVSPPTVPPTVPPSDPPVSPPTVPPTVPPTTPPDATMVPFQYTVKTSIPATTSWQLVEERTGNVTFSIIRVTDQEAMVGYVLPSALPGIPQSGTWTLSRTGGTPRYQLAAFDGESATFEVVLFAVWENEHSQGGTLSYAWSKLNGASAIVYEIVMHGHIAAIINVN